MKSVGRFLQNVHRSSRGQEGFTLVELMFAVTIMVAALLVLVYAISTGFSAIGYAAPTGPFFACFVSSTILAR